MAARFARELASRALLVAMVSVSTAAVAHHSAAQFDFAQTVRIEGVVKEMRVANPHIALFLEIKDPKGTRVIEYEGHSLNNYYRAGWRDGKRRRSCDITIGREALIAVEYALAARGLLVPH